MTLKQIVEKLNLVVLSAEKNLEDTVSFGYSSDLLSDVIANSKEKELWITLQIHLNIVAVAKLKELSGIILVNNRKPDEETLKKAEEENIPILSTQDSAFVISGKLYALLDAKK
ncbi:MAG: serine kinase [Candidatus Aminicenantes bacterium]|nr:serine kinase [Candidatus Aminicenantes bacterium]